MSDAYNFFNPIAWPWSNATNPAPSSIFPMAGSNGLAASPSGMLGSTFGTDLARPPNPPATSLNPPTPGAPAGNTLAGIGASYGAGGGATSAPTSTNQSIWDRINAGLGNAANKPGWLNNIQSLQKILGTGQGQQGGPQPAQFQGINMAKPIGAGIGTPPPATNPWLGMLGTPSGGGGGPSGMAGLLSPFLSAFQGNPYAQMTAAASAAPAMTIMRQ